MSDPTTQSNYLQVITQHIALDWKLDFLACELSGSADLTLLPKDDDLDSVILDTLGLEVKRVQYYLGDGDPQRQEVTYELGPEHPVMGSALTVPLPNRDKTPAGTVFHLHIVYTASRNMALQWLKKEQTQGKMFPFVFSQCQPIYARNICPIQDTPSVKITYTAKVTSVLPVLMSALRVFPPSDGPPHDGKIVGTDRVTYNFNQPIPIPSYLIALAAGNVQYRAFDRILRKEWTSGVWAEPETMEAAFWEFKRDTARFLSEEEDLITDYRFGVYDLLVLPPSFPYGGMENPCISFLTPSLLAGDRTLVNVVVHELTHSYFGNGVTHAHASHFWLNEGWTTYIERLMQQVIYGPAERGFSYIIGYSALEESLKLYETTGNPRYQRLIIEFQKGENPDDAYSRVPYEKGSNFLLHIERTLGGLDVFKPYIKDYVNTFMGQSITTDMWKDHLYAYFMKNGGDEKVQDLDSIDWEAWLYGEGTELPVKMTYDSSLATAAYDLADRWNASRATPNIHELDFTEADIKSFNTNQCIVFLDKMQGYPPLPSSHVTLLSALYQFATTSNGELRYRFYQLALRDIASTAAKIFSGAAAEWVIGEDGSGIIKGRMKFCRPTFRAIAKVDKVLARTTFNKAKSSFHPIAQKLIDADISTSP